jgi:hypothetical protein
VYLTPWLIHAALYFGVDPATTPWQQEPDLPSAVCLSPNDIAINVLPEGVPEPIPVSREHQLLHLPYPEEFEGDTHLCVSVYIAITHRPFRGGLAKIPTVVFDIHYGYIREQERFYDPLEQYQSVMAIRDCLMMQRLSANRFHLPEAADLREQEYTPPRGPNVSWRLTSAETRAQMHTTLRTLSQHGNDQPLPTFGGIYRDLSIHPDQAVAMSSHNMSLPSFAEAMSTLYDTLGGRPCLLRGTGMSNLDIDVHYGIYAHTDDGVPMMLRPHPTGHAIQRKNYHEAFDAQALEIIMTQGTAYRSRVLGALFTHDAQAREDWQAGVLLGITLKACLLPPEWPDFVPISEPFEWTCSKPSLAQPHREVSVTYTAQVCYLPMRTRDFDHVPADEEVENTARFVPGIAYHTGHTTTGQPVLPDDANPFVVIPEDVFYNVAADEYNSIDFPGCMELTRIYNQLHPKNQQNTDPWWDYPPALLGRLFPNQQWGPQWSVRDHV